LSGKYLVISLLAYAIDTAIKLLILYVSLRLLSELTYKVLLFFQGLIKVFMIGYILSFTATLFGRIYVKN
tara:strand:+ start:95 stop:304 length:210 start_codon:yes stop_codon:yes gene_type:complete